MARELTLIFSVENLRTLLENNPDKIVVRTTIEEGTLEEALKAGGVSVYADARQKGNPEPLATVTGCPSPPCSIDD